MKKLYFSLIVSLVWATTSNAQYCGTGRYDTEVFQSVQITSNITYGSNTGTSGATTLQLDVYEPTGDTLAMRPLIVWAHGGSFIGGTKLDGDVDSLSVHFAKRGYVCVSIDYRLGYSSFPPTTVAAQEAVLRAVQDMKAAIRYMRKDAATTNLYRIDPSMIFAGGSSAGAFTALHLAYMDQPSEIPTGLDTTVLGGLEGNSGNPGYASNVKAVIDLCGALGSKTYIIPGDIPFVAMHGNADGTVPYATAMIYIIGSFPVMVVDGSYSIAQYANTIGVNNEMYTYYGADHVPYASSTAYMDTTIRFVSNFLYRYLGCTPSDPFPADNTFTTGVESVLADNDVSISPNPASEKVQIQFKGHENNFSLYDISGRKLFELNKAGQDLSLDLTDYNSGLYFYKVENGTKVSTGKIVVQH